MTQSTDAGSGWKNDPKVRALVDGAIVSPKRSETQHIAGSDAVYSFTEPHLIRLLDAVAASRGGEGTDDTKRLDWLEGVVRGGDDVALAAEADDRVLLQVGQITEMVRVSSSNLSSLDGHTLREAIDTARNVARGAEP